MTQAALTRIDDRWLWADRGSCRDQPELFYNDEDDHRRVRRDKEDAAKDICERCPVIVQCRRYAIVAGELYGVWGGLTEMERHQLAGRARTG